ncbi:MAG TPA: hypothetical protein PK313_01030 [Myxococcota bacterium]|nr:hypothetical protein [Myxococcota bacterium]
MTARTRIRKFPIAICFTALALLGCGGGVSTPTDSGDTNPPIDVPNPDVDVPADPGPVDDGERPDPGGPFDIRFDIVPGGFLSPCSSNDECASGYCVEGPNGNICTKTCITGECPADFLCAGIVNTYPDIVFICIPKFSRVCQPCTVDNQCGGGKCVTLADGSYCTVPCGGSECPDPYECRTVDGDEADQSYCLPPSGTCACREADAGVKRFCEVTNEVGTCFGYETCDPTVGFTGCDARVPAAEDCNGIDDDCNGTPDDGLPVDESCDITNAFGTCPGVKLCLGPQGWTCTAATPAEEVCDGLDNDCKDGADDPFKIEDGRYGTLEHCGACNRSCVDIYPNATPACDTSREVPRCVVVDCAPGYFKLNDYQCIPLTSTLCATCVLDADCIVEGARCIQLPDGGNYCGQACTGDVDCPQGYQCLPAEGGADQCQPISGSCECAGDTNLSRGCSVTYQDPDNPGAPVYTCYGIQRCLETGWGACELPVETCDALDNDCDGVIDEGFMDPVTGRYVDDQNCGVCGNNCLANQVTNGYGACDATRTIPDCKVMCNQGFFDVDANPANGCECEFTSEVDAPGGADANCDGIDGDVVGSVFVAKWGTNGASGTIDDPLLNIQSAIDLAAGSPDLKDVYVATGVYTEPVVLKAGVGVYGGYSADFRVHEPVAYETVVLGQVPTTQVPGAVTAIGITGGAAASTVLDGFVVFAYNSKASGGNAIGVYVRDCDASVAIRDSRIVGGDGGDGVPGTPGAAGVDGVAGVPGTAAYDIGGDTCNASKETPGGAGGARTCGSVNVGGGVGGRAVCPVFDETPGIFCPDDSEQTRQSVENGGTGQNGGGAGGLAGLDSYIDDTLCGTSCTTCYVPDASKAGANGIPGPRGTDGTAGPRCAGTGSVAGGVWTPGSAGTGGTGTAGGGGGGGGAAGGVQTSGCKDGSSKYTDIGGSGGGGGSGGCGATGGSPGAGGGGSFAVFMTFAAAPATLPTLANLVIAPGRGGDGGNGGPGGVGGKPGAGADGGPDAAGDSATFCTAGGGSGAIGGAGGHGGGGGGGCGGPAYGLYVHGVAAGQLGGYKTAGLTFDGTGQGGDGGLGGASLGASGQDGEDGVAANFNF